MPLAAGSSQFLLPTAALRCSKHATRIAKRERILGNSAVFGLVQTGNNDAGSRPTPLQPKVAYLQRVTPIRGRRPFNLMRELTRRLLAKTASQRPLLLAPRRRVHRGIVVQRGRIKSGNSPSEHSPQRPDIRAS